MPVSKNYSNVAAETTAGTKIAVGVAVLAAVAFIAWAAYVVAPLLTSDIGAPVSRSADRTINSPINASNASVVPPVPSNLSVGAYLLDSSASGMSAKVNISWRNNCTSTPCTFIIERKDSAESPFRQIGVTATNTPYYYDFLSIRVSQTFLYRVRAVADGNASDYSEVSAAEVVFLPAAPSRLTAVKEAASGSSTASVSLNWADNSIDETGFYIERGVSLDSMSYFMKTDPNVTAVADSLTSGTGTPLYYYRVKAINSAGYSGFSNTASVRIK